MTKQEVINKINQLEIEKVKLIGRLELMEEQEKESKPVDNPEASA